MDTVKEIIRIAGYDDVESLPINELIEVDGGAFMDLSIEKVRDGELSVGHYYTQNYDLMSDPEVRFDVSGEEWTPVTFTQHGVPQVHERDEDGLDMKSFLSGWNSRLREQGFINKAKSQFNDH